MTLALLDVKSCLLKGNIRLNMLKNEKIPGHNAKKLKNSHNLTNEAKFTIYKGA